MGEKDTMANLSVGYIGQAMGKRLWAIDQILFLSMVSCQMRQFGMGINGEEQGSWKKVMGKRYGCQGLIVI